MRHLGPVVGWPRTSRRPAPKCRSPRVPRRPVPVGGVVVVLSSGVGTTQFRKGAVADWDCGLLGSTPPEAPLCVFRRGGPNAGVTARAPATQRPDPQGRFGFGRVGRFRFLPRPSWPGAWLARPRRGNRQGPYIQYTLPSVGLHSASVVVSRGPFSGRLSRAVDVYFIVGSWLPRAPSWCPSGGWYWGFGLVAYEVGPAGGPVKPCVPAG